MRCLRLLLCGCFFFGFAFAQNHRRISARPSLAIERRLAELKKNPPELYAFLYRMPKGADLHNHLAGAVYAESLLRAAAADHLCIDRLHLSLVRPPAGQGYCITGQVEAGTALSDNNLATAMIDSLSMRDFIPGAQSAHDHFFATFNKFLALGAGHDGEFVAEVAQRAADQNESYVELMALSAAGPISELGRNAGLDEDFDVTKKKLDDAGIQKLVAQMRAHVDDLEATRLRILGCTAKPDTPACRLKVRYIFQVLREFPKAQVFAQMMAGFALAASDPRVVAVNFVQPEDGLTSMRDYHLQMTMVNYAKRVYPTVHVSLHAGEIWPGLVPPEGLRFHIREAVEVAGAERIGHGTDIMYEKDPDQLLTELHDRHIAVEINLTSNDGILGVRGDMHPFLSYRKFGVPMAISTDDEGVNRSHMTEEFLRAVLTYNLTYADLKELVRNSIEYSFAPGVSYWQKHNYNSTAAECANRKSSACQEFISKNEKARLEAELEERFAEFERIR